MVKYGAGAGLLKRRGRGSGVGGWHFRYLIFSRLSFLHSEIIFCSAKLCYRFEEKLFFEENVFKKVILSCLKMNLSVCVRKVGVSD